MVFRYTKHATEKLTRLKQVGITLPKSQIEKTITHPERTETKPDGTFITMIGLDLTHVLRVVYRQERKTIIIITMYPGRRKQYGLPLRS